MIRPKTAKYRQHYVANSEYNISQELLFQNIVYNNIVSFNKNLTDKKLKEDQNLVKQKTSNFKNTTRIYSSSGFRGKKFSSEQFDEVKKIKGSDPQENHIFKQIFHGPSSTPYQILSEKYKETKLLAEMKLNEISPTDYIDAQVYENAKSNLMLQSQLNTNEANEPLNKMNNSMKNLQFSQFKNQDNYQMLLNFKQAQQFEFEQNLYNNKFINTESARFSDVQQINSSGQNISNFKEHNKQQSLHQNSEQNEKQIFQKQHKKSKSQQIIIKQLYPISKVSTLETMQENFFRSSTPTQISQTQSQSQYLISHSHIHGQEQYQQLLEVNQQNKNEFKLKLKPKKKIKNISFLRFSSKNIKALDRYKQFQNDYAMSADIATKKKLLEMQQKHLEKANNQVMANQKQEFQKDKQQEISTQEEHFLQAFKKNIQFLQTNQYQMNVKKLIKTSKSDNQQYEKYFFRNKISNLDEEIQ